EVLLRNEDDICFIYDILGEVGEFRGTTLAGDEIVESNLGVLGAGSRSSLLPAGANIAAAIFEGDHGEIQALIQALTEDQLVRVHANPIILTIEGQPAMLNSGDEIPYLARASLGNVETFVSESQKTGVNLVITPVVTYLETDAERKHPYITVSIQANLSSVTRFREEQGFTQPIVDTRQYITNVSLREGERILIGGLFRDSQVRKSRGIPILRDIPLLGRLFRSSTDSKVISQLFVMVRPLLLDIWEEGLETRFMDSQEFKESREIFEKEMDGVNDKDSPFEEFHELFIEHGSPK
ncbi:MAG: type II and III secretion system protein, partial [bacterium]|nr:type II and III secretion system protein [bacterium]